MPLFHRLLPRLASASPPFTRPPNPFFPPSSTLRTIKPPAPRTVTAPRRRYTSTAAAPPEPAHDEEMGKPEDKKGSAFNLKVPKGTRDWSGADAALRDKIFSQVTTVFKRHGAETLDTPVFELRDILSGKYGEDSKLIYDLADQGGELCSLRYDLTVPLARYLAMNPSIQTFKRYQIAKVYRRDQPAMTKGRMREFYQCDFDIAGTYDPMIADAQVLRVAWEVFDSLGWDNYTIKINHRKVLDGIFKVAGVPEALIRPISSAVDKLDKLPWDDVKKEMVEKTLDAAVADRIGEWVKHKGKADIIALLRADPQMAACDDIVQGTAEMETLFSYLDVLGVMDRISFDLSLARGLDYYTGVIYEVVTEGSAPSGKGKGEAALGVGSVAAGGRYDSLVGMFSGKPIPCVGISFGIDRILSILKARSAAALRPRETSVFVMAFGGKGFDGMLLPRMRVARTLWDAGISTEFAAKVKPKLQAQFKAAETAGVRLAVILGEDELKEGMVRVKVLGLEEGNPEKDGVLVRMEHLVDEVRSRI